MKNTYLITGGAGFIGSHLIDRLLLFESNSTVINVDNFDPAYSEKIKQENLHLHRKFPNCKMYIVSITDYESLRKVFEVNPKITHIVHFAGQSGNRLSLDNPQEYFNINVNGTVNLLNLAKEYRVPKFIFASSCSVYGFQEKTPFAEDMNTDMPISPYAASKSACERICYTYSHLYGIKTYCLRLFSVYGPRQNPDKVIHKFLRQIAEGRSVSLFGDGSASRDYTYIDDAVNGILSALEYEDSEFDILNIGTSKPVSLKELVCIIEEKMEKQAIIERRFLNASEIPVTCADISRAKNILGYNPSISIEQGIEYFVDWFKAFYSYVV